MLIMGIITVGHTAAEREHALLFMPIMLGLMAAWFVGEYVYNRICNKK